MYDFLYGIKIIKSYYKSDNHFICDLIIFIITELIPTIFLIILICIATNSAGENTSARNSEDWSQIIEN